MKLDPMLEEALVATVSMFILGVFIALSFYVVTGISPGPSSSSANAPPSAWASLC